MNTLRQALIEYRVEYYGSQLFDGCGKIKAMFKGIKVVLEYLVSKF